jgi:hypothetical protein
MRRRFSGNSVTLQAVVPSAPPRPTGFSATGDDGRIFLEWDGSSAGANWALYRSTGNTENFASLVSLPKTATSYTDGAGIVNGTRYYYRLYNVNAAGSSLPASANALAQDTVEPPPSSGSTTLRTFSSHERDHPNPERGMTENHLAYSSFGSGHPRPLPTVGSTTPNCRIVRRVWVLHDFLDSAISSSFLNFIADDFERARNQGIKLIPHFCYWFNGPLYPGMVQNYGQPPGPNNPPSQYDSLGARDAGKTDTDKNRIKAHIDQIAPIVNANKDVVAWMQAGFLGAWGEGNKSAHGLDYDNSNPAPAVKEVLDHLFLKIDTDIMIGLRYPPAANAMYGSALTVSEAYTGTNKARLMLFDDYLGETFPISYNQAQTLYTGQNGEGVPGGYNANNIAGGRGIDYLSAGHFSALQPIGSPFTTNSSRNGWADVGIYDDILRRLGYRFHLESARVPDVGTKGQFFVTTLRLRNQGFANPINRRRLEIVFRNRSTSAVTRIVALTDIRKNFPNPGTVKDLTAAVTIPSNQASGNYDVLLNLPDPHFLNPTNNALKYSMRLMSDYQGADIFQSTTGFNLIGTTRID